MTFEHPPAVRDGRSLRTPSRLPPVQTGAVPGGALRTRTRRALYGPCTHGPLRPGRKERKHPGVSTYPLSSGLVVRACTARTETFYSAVRAGMTLSAGTFGTGRTVSGCRLLCRRVRVPAFALTVVRARLTFGVPVPHSSVLGYAQIVPASAMCPHLHLESSAPLRTPLYGSRKRQKRARCAEVHRNGLLSQSPSPLVTYMFRTTGWRERQPSSRVGTFGSMNPLLTYA